MTEYQERKFISSVETWRTESAKALGAAEAYRVANAKALMASDAKTDTARKADADLKTTVERNGRDLSELSRDAAYHTMIFYRGSAGEKEASR